MLFCSNQFAFKATFFGALLLSTSSLAALAEEARPAAQALPTGITVSGNVMSMRPIPDGGPAPQTVTAAPSTTTRPAVAASIMDSISLTERPAMIIHTGAIAMAPIPDRDAGKGEQSAIPSGKGSELNCLARAVYFEARGESARGQAAVAQVVLARKRTPGRPKTICGVVYEGSHLSTGCQFSFTCDGIPDTIDSKAAWSRAKNIALRAMRGKLKQVVRGATFYHANYVHPYWAASMQRVATIGSHIFYRP